MGSAVSSIIGAGTSMIAQTLENEGKRKALNAQMDALGALESIDPEKYAALAKKGDIDAWKNRLDAMRQVDPELATIREQSIKAFTTALAKNASETNRSDEIAKKVFGLANQFAAGAPAEIALGDAFLDKAKEKLGRGGQLPPTYQAELIRSGLEQGGAAGIGSSRTGPVAGVLGKLIGSAQMDVERQNEQDAAMLAQAGTQIAGNRMNILQGLIPQFQNYEGARTNLAAQGLAAVNSETPSKIGASGADMVNMNEAARIEKNQVTTSMGDLEALQRLRQGNFVGGLVRTGGEALANAAGLAMGGTGMLSGLMGGGSTAKSNAPAANPGIPMLQARSSQGWGAMLDPTANITSTTNLNDWSAYNSSGQRRS